ncbi:hypothetical protein BDV93DRAFT_24211 [Ceratobasidium sp. AG-I]|nr:hypothetical protein BDV93DRAFT_24211 [Ceratobasidium sp. AG-I]
MATEAPLIMSQSHQLHRPHSLLIPPNPAYTPTSPRGGILLNAARSSTSATLSPFTPPSSSSSGLWPGTYTPRSPSPLSATLSPDGTRTDRSQSINGSRKIRFAPLPEPRRDVMVDEDGSEIPCSATYAADATSFPVQSPGAGSSVTLDRTDSLVTDSGASTASTETDTQSQTTRKKAKRNSLLKIFGMGGSSSTPKRASTCSLPAADSNGTIGGIPVPGLGLFRASSRESWSGEPSGYTSDNSLSRRMSSPLRPESSTRKSVQPNYGSFGAPLMHAVSDGSGTARPQRMLNGRVYGARRARERIQPQPSMEPEFSEWGYGGMGSVSTAGEYGKLQSNASSVGGANPGDDDDDGSGMTWIRKRREKKEQEERERKAAEEAAAEAAKASEESAETGSEARASTETAHSTPTIHAEPTDMSAPQTPTGQISEPVLGSPGSMQPPSRSNTSPQPARIQHSRNASRQNSGATITADRHVQAIISVPVQHRGRHDAPASGTGVKNPETSPDRSSSDSSPQSSDDEDAEGSSSTTGRDDDEEEEEDNEKRKTALSAGIEKISRHHA